MPQSTPKIPKPKLKLKINIKLYLTIFIILIGSFLTYLFVIKNSEKIIKNIIPKILNKIEEKTNRKILIANFEFYSNSIHIEEVKITEPKSNQIFFQTKKIEISYDPYLILTTKKIFVDKLKIYGMKLNLKKQGDMINFVDIMELFKESDESIYKRYIIKDLEIINSEVIFKENENEFLFRNINVVIKHTINLPFFYINGNFEMITAFKNIIISGNILIKNIRIVDYLEKINGEIKIDNFKIDKTVIDFLNSYIDYIRNKSIEIKISASKIFGFSDYMFFKKIEKNYNKIFSKKITDSLSFVDLEFKLSKDRSISSLKSDSIELESIIDFVEKKHIFNLNISEIKAQSNSKIFNPKIKSNLSETLNNVIKELIKRLENIFLELKEEI